MTIKTFVVSVGFMSHSVHCRSLSASHLIECRNGVLAKWNCSQVTTYNKLFRK